MEEKNQSDVARIKRQIQAEYDAAYLALHGPAVVAQHKTITTHLENMSEHGDVLADLVGNEEAMQFLMQVMDDQEEIRRLYAELQNVPSYFERFRDERKR